MKIKMRWSHDIDHGASIQEFARMEKRLQMPNHSGVYEDHITVPVCAVGGYLLLIHIALGEDGYHISTSYETNTGGGGSWPTIRSVAYKTKEAAFKAGVKNLLRADYLKQFSHHINQAMAQFYSASCVQLTLF